ncbi:MAG: transporter substrate-binding domain-containing protein [Rhodocyclaceae bacterium]|nr:transporter substrate-binding domain-containing protein [Rhodocyclaceae bacterium]
MSAISRGVSMSLLVRWALICVAMLAGGQVLAAEPLVVAVNHNDRPFCWTNERGELTGFSVDVARALCKAMKSECRLTVTNFADFIPGVVEKRFDFVVANVLHTPEREQLVDFTDRFWRSSSMFVGKPGVARDISKQALKGRSVGVQKGSVQEKYLYDHFADAASVKSFPTNTERNNALMTGKVDLIFGSTVSHYAFLSTAEGAKFEFIGGPIDGQGLGGDVAIPLAKGRDDLRKRLNAAISAILHDGTFAKINNTYFSASVF